MNLLRLPERQRQMTEVPEEQGKEFTVWTVLRLFSSSVEGQMVKRRDQIKDGPFTVSARQHLQETCQFPHPRHFNQTLIFSP